MMAALNGAVGPETAIYVHANAAAAFEYYAPQFSLGDAAYRVGSCQLADGRALLEEVDPYRGQRDVWVVMTHMITTMAGQRDDLLRYLDAIGRRTRSLVVPSNRAGGAPLPAEAFHYDLSDPARLGQVHADGFPVHGNYSRTQQACEEGPIRMTTLRRQR